MTDRIVITLDIETIRAIDALRKIENRNRSNMIETIIKEWLKNKRC